jgi:type I restriction enzyme S subunit
MTETEKRVPDLRFKGFIEDWEQRTLTTLMDFSNGINAPKENYGKGRKMISVMDILSKEPISYDNIRNSVEVDSKTESNNKVENGDIVFVRSSEVRNEVGWAKAYLENEFALYSGFTIRGKKIFDFDAFFVELSINGKNREQIESKAGGSTRFNVSQSILKSVVISEPSLVEQKKISAFFKQLDDTIALHQRKLTLLEQLKQSYLQLMCPQNKGNIPALRFAGFSEPWEQRKIRELFTVTRGQVLAATKTKDKETNNFIYPVYSSQTKNNGLMGFYDQYLFENAITWTTDGANAGTVNFRKGKFYSTNVNGVLLSDKGFANKAISEIINKIAWKHVSKVGNPKLMNNVMSEITVTIPFVEEQNKLSLLFEQLDDTIDLHKCMLDKLLELRLVFLRKMFL